jgi:hypothetical protein
MLSNAFVPLVSIEGMTDHLIACVIVVDVLKNVDCHQALRAT